MKKLRWPLLIALVAVAAIAILLYNYQQPSQPKATVAPLVIQPEAGGIYVEALIGSLGRLNPLLDSNNPVDRDVDRLLYSGLVRFDERGLPQPDLASSWGISNDGLNYNFSLNPHAVWHDGEPVTSDDVIFTIEMLRDEQSLVPADFRTFWNQVQIERLDDKTLRFTLPEPYAPFLDYLTFGIVPAHLLGDLTFSEMIHDHFNISPIGSGPYRFDHIIVEGNRIVGIVLTAFPDYYAAKPYIEQVSFRYYPDGLAALAAYRNNDVMGISQVTDDLLPEILREPKLRLQTSRLSELTLVFFNLDNPAVPFLQDANVRRALLLGLNRQWMVDHILGGQAILADGPIFPGTWAYYDGIEHLGYDPQTAVTLLKKAGYTIPAEGGAIRAKEGVVLQLELLYPNDELHAALAEAIRDDWAALGVGVDLKAVSYAELVENYLENRTHQAALVDLNLAQSPDPDPYPFWHQAQITGGQNYSKWNDRRASEYLEQARVTLDIGERTRLYHNFQVRFAQELPSLPLFYPVYNYAVDVRVQGVRMGALFSPSDRFDTFGQWYLIAKQAVGLQITATP